MKALKLLLSNVVLFVILVSNVAETSEEKCHVSISGIQLKGHVMESAIMGDIHSCFTSCLERSGCQSINFYESKILCEFNNRTIDNMPSMKASNEEAVYFQNPNPTAFVEEPTVVAPSTAQPNSVAPSTAQPNSGFLDSVILRNYGNSSYSQDLRTFVKPVQKPNHLKWVKCWRAATEGLDVELVFHPNCDDKGSTLTIIRDRQYIFGGFSDVSWGIGGYARSSQAFLFSLYNTDGYKPLKFPVVDQAHAVARYFGQGPTFGRGHDLVIHNDNDNYWRVSSYKPPPGCSDYCSFYTGNIQGRFKADDIEVFYETTS